MTFDPNKYMIQLKNRSGQMTDYLPVAARLAWFRADHPDGIVVVDHHAITEQVAIFRATVSIPNGGSAQGWGSETPQDFRDYIEKASTKSLGRALAALGYGVLEAGDELDEGDRIVDSPVARPQQARSNGSAPARVSAPPAAQSAPQTATKAPPPPGPGCNPDDLARSVNAAWQTFLGGGTAAQGKALLRGLWLAGTQRDRDFIEAENKRLDAEEADRDAALAPPAALREVR